MNRAITSVLILPCIFAGVALTEQLAGYRRDGTGICPDCTPPTTWTEKDVLWETPLPSWGTGSPSYVAGKLFVFCEPAPGFDFPLLVCLDAKTGAELWRRKVGQLFGALPGACGVTLERRKGSC
jgi:hypothetical protein